MIATKMEMRKPMPDLTPERQPIYAGKILSELTLVEIEQALDDVRALPAGTQRELAFITMVEANLMVELGRRKGLIK
jgi:hypothetical protein